MTVRGPHPCCVMQDIDAMIRSIANKNANITTSVGCSTCVVQDGFLVSVREEKECITMCRKGHKLGIWSDVLEGKLDHTWKVSNQLMRQEVRMDDKVCPKLFLMLPINMKSLSWPKRIVSLLKDGWAVHLLCECPNEFAKKYVKRAYQVLNAISMLGVPLSAAALVVPQVEAAKPVPWAAKQGAEYVKQLLQDFTETFPDLAKDADQVDIYNPDVAEGLSRRQVAYLLNHQYDENANAFGELIPTLVRTRILWLCKKHNRDLKQLKQSS